MSELDDNFYAKEYLTQLYQICQALLQSPVHRSMCISARMNKCQSSLNYILGTSFITTSHLWSYYFINISSLN